MTQVTWILLLSVIHVPTHGLAGLPEEGKQREGQGQAWKKESNPWKRTQNY